MELDIAQLSDKAIIAFFIWLLYGVLSVTSEEIYFDKFGHCQNTQPFDLANEQYILRHIGGGFAHETLICDVTLKAPASYGICITFTELEINDCSVRLQIYASFGIVGTPWRVLGCTDTKPGQMCTTSRHVTVRVSKEKLNYNRGYAFQIHVQKGNNFTNNGVFFASLGVFVAVILGAVFLIAVMAIFLIYCCCRRRKRGTKTKEGATTEALPHEHISLIQPSAPVPDLEDSFWTSYAGGHLYPHSPCGPYPPHNPPPPYLPPPPYQLDNTKEEPATPPDPHESCPAV